ncbi:MAG: ABC transporter permease, partial [Eubacteriales bacterium]|nr:ABC transporter permease [Eubacteriales bacterium]
MKRGDFWKLSLLNVTASPVRSLLTVLGMAIGVGAILAVLTLGDAGKTQVESEMMRLGIDKVWLSQAVQPLRHGDGALLSEALETTVTEQAYGRLTVRTDRGEAECVVVGCSQDYLRLMDARLCAGRELHPLEWSAGSRAVLLGRELARTLGCEGGAGRVALGGLLLETRGVISLQNQLSQIDGDSALFLPISVFCELMGGTVQELTLSVRR